jgi:mono/diheme cytochrome c family protein
MMRTEDTRRQFRLTRTVTLGLALAAAATTLTGVAAPAPDGSGTVTFTKQVAPIFQKSCQTCHHPGTAAPMSLITYQDVRPWARSIKARVTAREMPPWHLDKTVGIREYKNDISLSDDEIDTIVKWVDSGTPQGDPKDMPPPLTFRPETDWFIGKPDLTVTFDKEMTMYASGPDWWINKYADTGLTEDRWVKAMQIKPGNPKIVHHAVTSVIPPEGTDLTDSGFVGGEFEEYAVGKYGTTFPENTGRLLPKGSRIAFDMHYFAIGEEAKDRTTLGIVFYPKGYVPKYKITMVSFRNLPNDDLEIPPNSVVRHDGYFRLPKAARIVSFQPHMHMRGKGMTLEAINLDNSVTTISSTDHFDFNWHIAYVYKDDVAPLLPAGTMLHAIGIHDNTSANRRNPDPLMWAGYGERSVDDMLQLRLAVVYLEDPEYQAQVAERKAQVQQRALTGGNQQ